MAKVTAKAGEPARDVREKDLFVEIAGFGKVPVPKLVPTDHTGVIKIHKDVAAVLRLASETFNLSVADLTDPVLRALAHLLLHQMKGHVGELTLADKPHG